MRGNVRSVWGALVLAFVFLGVTGCSSRNSVPDYIFGTANVLEIHVTASATPTERTSVTVVGTLRDGCTSIDSVRQSLEGWSLVVTVSTRRPIEGTCHQGTVPFEKTIPLVLRGLRPGEYRVVCGGVEAAFKIGQGDEVTAL